MQQNAVRKIWTRVSLEALNWTGYNCADYSILKFWLAALYIIIYMQHAFK